MDCRVPKQATEQSTVVVRTLFHLVDLRSLQLHELVCQKTPIWTRLIRQRSSLSRSCSLKVPLAYFFQFDVELYEAVCEYAAMLLQERFRRPTATPDQPLQSQLHNLFWYTGGLGKALPFGRMQRLSLRGQSVDGDAPEHRHVKAQRRSEFLGAEQPRGYEVEFHATE